MDKEETRKEASDEVTRESLIAISYRLPEKDQSPGDSTNKPSGENLVEGINSDGSEKYRSELISISYSPSPDTKSVPVPGEIKG
ncbi:Sperm acrosome-associated protein [Actinidia chinensis var. chinensis]|uniref:Sperm acrosome-associated protein n=2 Tax=Actinidia TaxID=3624 RepID=A0A2R6QPZ6_ACTCC|nr:Sperm acrosome-associated protein [Actinidia chinensis var. chinensis]